MCTAITFQTKDHYFGRNLDVVDDFRECVTIMPRRFPLSFQFVPDVPTHYAMIGMATISDGYPLYFDATNEAGLSAAGLSFRDNAYYEPAKPNGSYIAPFELIPWVLSECSNIGEARNKLETIRIGDIVFNMNYPATPLHWLFADSTTSIVVEQQKDGLHIYENPIGILTNNPPFPFHKQNLKNYLHLSNQEATNLLSPKLPLTPNSYGLCGIGLPGDLSSASRFIRAAFTKFFSVCGESEHESVSQFFHILNSVSQPRGCTIAQGQYELTHYSSCCNTSKGIYYYKTYDNHQITGVDLFGEALDTADLIRYPLRKAPNIRMEHQNDRS